MNMKKRVLQKIAAFAMTATMMMSAFAVTAQAEGLPTISADKDVSLTITKYEGDSAELDESVTGSQTAVDGKTPMAGVTFTAVKVADLVQDVAGADGALSLAYRLNAAGAVFMSKTEGDIVTGTELNTYIADKTAQQLREVINTNNIAAKDAVTDAAGVVKFQSAEVEETASVKKIEGQGLYLIVETNAPASVTKYSHPFFASLPMTDKTTGNSWMYDVYAYPKNSTASTDLDKKITKVEDTDKTNGGKISGVETAEAQITDVISYCVPLTAVIPDGGLTKLGIVDTMSKGLTFKKAGDTAASADVTVLYVNPVTNTEDKVAESNYTVTEKIQDGKTVLTVAFTDVYIKTLNEGADKNPKFKFQYAAVLNADAVLGTTGNTNEVHYYYNYNNNPTPDQDVTSDDEKTTVYSWGIDLTKTGAAPETTLQGVEFTLKSGSTALKFVKDENGDYILSEAADASETLVTAEGGKLYIRGLKSGTYELTETKTAPGYVLLKDPVTIVITGNEADGTAEAAVGGKTATLKEDNRNSGSSSALVPVTIVNKKGFSLPVTGGTGITVFTFAGIAIAVLAAVLLLMRRKSYRK